MKTISTQPVHAIRAVGLIALACVMLGCEEQVAAPTGVEEPFSMFGILNPRLDTQTVAVSPIKPLLYAFPDSIDARVTSTDLETGETHLWKDSVVAGRRGQRDHIFHSDFRARFGSSYRLTATRSDGIETSVVATIPDVIEVSNDDSKGQVFYVYTQGRDFSLNRIEMVYTVTHFAVGPTGGGTSSPDPPEATVDKICGSNRETYAIEYSGEEIPLSDGYKIDVHLALDHYEVLKRYQHVHHFEYIPGYSDLALLKLEVRLIVGEEAWSPPGGEFNSNALAQPRTMSNVENGYGFVGGGYNHEARVYPTKEAVESTFFFDFLERPPSNCVDICSCSGR